ncbi:hypothetical protein GCM10022225_70100 [Plantactinospora mayteni]|uniref:Uncharacterized protein n=1 Tax=Plantactinospora mayteni TaxID=566021 RepID=A0ABQ4EW89_9ACTN|nr:hypothetical protein Pma05_54420 [Plantactinospora mayteni]
MPATPVPSPVPSPSPVLSLSLSSAEVGQRTGSGMDKAGIAVATVIRTVVSRTGRPAAVPE